MISTAGKWGRDYLKLRIRLLQIEHGKDMKYIAH